MNNALRPAQIIANRETREFTVEWNDQHRSVYPFGLLRAGCPCASCRGGHEYMREDPDEAVFSADLADTPATRIQKVEAVGSYALMIEWADGHHFGIYTWPYLRKLCPCEVCRGDA